MRTNAFVDANVRSTSVVSVRRVSAASSRLAIEVMSSELSGPFAVAPVEGVGCAQAPSANRVISASTTLSTRQLLFCETALHEVTNVWR